MNAESISPTGTRRNTRSILAVVWLVIDLLILLPVQNFLHGSFPLFTVIWLLPPLIYLFSAKDSGKIGIRRVPVKMFLTALGFNGLGVLLIMLLLEPWSQTYQALVLKTLVSPTPDTTFAWLVRFPGWQGIGLMFLYSSLVTLFAEELFFRGWLLQWLGKRLSAVWAILLQAFLFTLPQAIAAFFLTPIQAFVYVVCYSFLAIGVIGGWAAWRTKSIWPGLVTASLMNLVLVILTV